MSGWEVQIGDCLGLAKALPDDSIDCIVTSPPYWSLRDYKNPDAWGLEPTLGEYLARLGSLFEELRRALKPTGTCWVNMGDAYASDSKWGGSTGGKHVEGLHGATQVGRNKVCTGLPDKNLIGLPWRVAFMLQDQGWYLRSDIIWAKPNPMPESVRDRPTRAHEYIFLLAKCPRYAYDADAIRTPLTDVSIARLEQPNYANQNGSTRAHGGVGYVRGALVQGKTNGNMKAVAKKSDKQRGHSRRHDGFNDRWDAMEKSEQCANGANARTVWDIATVGFPDAHFATFPPELPKRCILAGCQEGGLVLDPFSGSGTTGMVAVQLGRRYLGFEVNPDYAEMPKGRIESVTPSLFSEAAV